MPNWPSRSGPSCRSCWNTNTTDHRSNRNAWGDGSLLLQSVEEYHASYMSIHWWPHEFLEKNRDVIDRINRRLGYRLQLQKLSWPRPDHARPTVHRGGDLGQRRCRTLLSGRIHGHHAQGSAGGNRVGPRAGPAGSARTRRSAHRIKRRPATCSATLHDGSRVLGRTTQLRAGGARGTYDVYVSVGTLDGTPRIALPLDQEDGQRRYRVGSIEVLSP